MFRTRRSTLDLTPLLDVVLILLFVFMFMVVTQAQDLTDKLNESNENLEEAENQLENTSLSIEEKDDYIKQLEAENAELKTSNEGSEEQLEQLEEQLEEQSQTIDNATKAIAAFLQINESEVEKLLAENEISAETLEDFTTIEDVSDSLLKYDALSKQFYFIDVEIKGGNNRIYINDESTSVGISFSEVNDSESESAKIKEIKELIEENYEARQGGSAMTFITLRVYDKDVYKYAWQVVWYAIGEVQEKYGTDKVYRTHITLIY